MLRFVLIFAGFMHLAPAASSPEISDEDLKIRFKALSQATLVDGSGWQTYEKLLHPSYARWAMGEVYEGREKFIRSLEQWWNYGMRVARRDTEIIGFDQVGDLAIIRSRITEEFVGPNGPTEGFSGYVSNVWVKEDGEWFLLSADISSIPKSD